MDPPCHLEGALLELELTLACAPITGTVNVVGVCLTCFGLWDGAGAGFRTKGHEGAVGMKDGEVAFELVDEVELHLCESVVFGRERLDAVFVTEEHSGFGDDGLDVNRGLFCLCGDITAGGDDDEGVCLAV